MNDEDDGPLATLPGYTVSDYDPALLVRPDWYCLFSSLDTDAEKRTHCSSLTKVHHDLAHVRRILNYAAKSRHARPFERHHIYRLVLPEGERLPDRPAHGWQHRHWRVAGRRCAIEFVETVVLTRARNIALVEHQITRGR